jgi:hypothetical protein
LATHSWKNLRLPGRTKTALGAFDDNVPRVTKPYFRNAGPVKYYRQYQSQYSNYVTWIIDQLQAQGVEKDSPTITELRGIQKDLFEEGKRSTA